MSNLEWCKLVERFYSFKYEAEKHNFYCPELKNMESSLDAIRPFEKDEEIEEKLKNLAKRREESCY